MLRLRENFKRKFTELRTCRSGWTVRCNDKVEQNNGVSCSSYEYEVHGILHFSDRLERFNSASRRDIVYCTRKLEHYRHALRQVESRVSNTSSSKFQHCDANRVEYAYFSAPCGS